MLRYERLLSIKHEPASAMQSNDFIKRAPAPRNPAESVLIVDEPSAGCLTLIILIGDLKRPLRSRSRLDQRHSRGAIPPIIVLELSVHRVVMFTNPIARGLAR